MSITHPAAALHSRSVHSCRIMQLGPITDSDILHLHYHQKYPSSITQFESIIDLKIYTFLPILQPFYMQDLWILHVLSIKHYPPIKVPLYWVLYFGSRDCVNSLATKTYFCLFPLIRLSKLTCSRIFICVILLM